MNYIELINQFWKLRRSKRITNLQADLYFYLIQESNSRDWENPFQSPNGIICSAIGISEKSLIDARNVLQQIGLIKFESGITKQKAPVYYLLKVSKPVSIRGSNNVVLEGVIEGTLIQKTKRKQNKTEEGPPAVAEPPPIKNKKFKIEKFLQPEVIPFQSQNFVSNWKKLLESPKWAKKNESAIEMALEKMKKYNEQFVIQQIERAIIGQWQGLFFTNTDSDYQKFLQQNANIKSNNQRTVFDAP